MAIGNRARKGSAAICAVAAVAIGAAAPASAKSIGSSLNHPANAAGVTCNFAWQAGFGPITDGLRQLHLGNRGADQQHREPASHRAAAASVPSSGRIKQVRVKVPDNPARLRVTVLRQITTYYPNGEFKDTSCCQGVDQSGTFRPRANRTSAFNVNLKVESEYHPNQDVAWVDYVGISGVSNGNLPIFSQGAAAHENSLTPGSYQSRAIWPARPARAEPDRRLRAIGLRGAGEVPVRARELRARKRLS